MEWQTKQHSQCICESSIAIFGSYMLKLPVKIILLLSHMSTTQMDFTSNQRSGGCAKVEIKQVHVISSSGREKKEQSGGGREEWRTESEEIMKETMVTRMEDGGWRKGDAQPDRGWRHGRRRDYLQSVAVIMAWCVGRVFSDKENLRLRLPLLQNPQMSRRSHIHSIDRNRKRQGG